MFRISPRLTPLAAGLCAAALLAACEKTTTTTNTPAGTATTTTVTPSPSATATMDRASGAATSAMNSASSAMGSAVSSASSAMSNAGDAIGDAAVTAKVKTALLADDNVKGLQIDVDTKDGVVTLNGTADTQANMSKAQTIAQGIEGVKSVENKLAVKP